jgi:hypothetical protein
MVRVTDVEEAQLRLRADAENVTIPRLLIERALADGDRRLTNPNTAPPT